MTTASVSTGMPSGLQFAASCQFAVPAPPSQDFSAACAGAAARPANAAAAETRRAMRPRSAARVEFCMEDLVFRARQVRSDGPLGFRRNTPR